MRALLRKARRFLDFSVMFVRRMCVEAASCVRIYVYQCKYSNSPEVMMSKLRVLSHALDKGLCTTGRQRNRGRDKYDACKTLIAKLSSTNVADDPSYKWGYEKICEYERLHGGGTCLKGDQFNAPTADERARILDFIKSRRSVRNFKDTPIGSDVLASVVDVGRWAPNSCCRQAVYFYVCDDKEKINSCMALTPGATCFSENVPCFITVCGDSRLYPLQDKGLLFIDGALAIENLLLAAHSYGIEGTVLNWRQHKRSNEQELRKRLGIAPHHSIVANIALGYPEFIPPAPSRMSLNSVWRLVGVE